MIPSIGIAIVALLLAGYFAALNSALKTFSRSRLADLLDKRGRLPALEPFAERLPKHMLITAMLRTCLGLVTLLATLYTIETAPGIGGQRLSDLGEYAVAFVITGVAVSIFVVALPVAWSRYHPETIVASAMPLLAVLLPLFGIVTGPLHLFDPLVRRVSGTDDLEEDHELASDQLAEDVISVVEDQAGVRVDDEQKEMLEAVFDLPNTTAGEIMTPRTRIEGIEAGATLQQVKDAIIEMGHSRIPVYRESLDHIVGILYAKDLIRFIGDGAEFDLGKVLRPAYLVPESKSVRELLQEFKGRKVHLAIVLDEYGGTAGLVTIEDILEEIVGEIQDEYEQGDEPTLITPIDDATSDVDATIHLEELNEEIGLSLPEDEDYDTLSGFITAQLGHIPQTGETLDAEGVRFTVLDAERTRVKRVRIEKLAAPASATPAAPEPTPTGK